MNTNNFNQEFNQITIENMDFLYGITYKVLRSKSASDIASVLHDVIDKSREAKIEGNERLLLLTTGILEATYAYGNDLGHSKEEINSYLTYLH